MAHLPLFTTVAVVDVNLNHVRLACNEQAVVLMDAA
jgi:hypothetical protein